MNFEFYAQELVLCRRWSLCRPGDWIGNFLERYEHAAEVIWLSFMALLVHQFEEMAWPGGFLAVMNIAWQPSEVGKPDRYKLNRQSNLFVNVFFAYPFYILPIIFSQPDLAWIDDDLIWHGAIWRPWDRH